MFFILENAVLSENRTWIIEQLGDDQYHAVYGTFSTIATASIGYTYYRIRKGPMDPALRLWTKRLPPTPAAAGFVFLSMGLAMATQTLPKLQIPFALVNPDASAGPAPANASWNLQVRCPFDFAHGKNQDGSALHGLERISRHPGLWSFGLIGLGQAMMASSIPLQIWWTGPVAIAWLGGAHTDSRFRRGMGGTLDPRYDAETSNVPFAAMLTGRQGSDSMRKMMEEGKPLNAAVAILASGLWVARRIR